MFFQALVLCAALETGFVSGGMFNYTEFNHEWADMGALYTTLEATAKSGIFYAGGRMDSYFTPISLTNYAPFQMTFIFRAGINIGAIQIGYERSCFHPLQPYSTFMGIEIKPKYEGGYNKFFVRLETK